MGFGSRERGGKKNEKGEEAEAAAGVGILFVVQSEMEEGSSLGLGRGSAKKGEKNGSEAKIEPFVSERGHDPKELRSWAKRTGFVSTFSGEAETERRESSEGRRRRNGGGGVGNRLDLEKGIAERNESESSMISPKIEIDPILGKRTTRNPPEEIQQVAGDGDGGGVRVRGGAPATAIDAGGGLSNGNGSETVAEANAVGKIGEDGVDGGWHPAPSPSPSPRMVLGLKDNPGYG